MIQRYIGFVLLACGATMGCFILINALRHRDALAKENGRVAALGIAELIVYVFATLGISDFLLNTLIARKMRLMEDEKLPGSLVACGLTPGSVIACSLLQVDNPVELVTLVLCALSIIIGCLIGAKVVGKIDPAKIRKVMGICLIGSLIALIIKIIVSAGATGEATGLNLPMLCIAVPFGIFWGIVNMIGVPMKPAGTAVFLMMGMSPLSTLTLVLVMGSIGPMSGAVPILRRGAYHKKIVCAAVICGTVGAILGTLFAISVNALLLNILLLIVMVIAIVSMLK